MSKLGPRSLQVSAYALLSTAISSSRALSVDRRRSRSGPCTHNLRLAWAMSALPPKADIRQRIEHVCFVPEADIKAADVPAPSTTAVIGRLLPSCVDTHTLLRSSIDARRVRATLFDTSARVQ